MSMDAMQSMMLRISLESIIQQRGALGGMTEEELVIWADLVVRLEHAISQECERRKRLDAEKAQEGT